MSIQSYYDRYLGRSADAGGLAFYQKQLDSGSSMADIQQAIRGSTEARNRYTSNIQRTAQTALGRNLGTSGNNFFTDAVASGQGSLTQAMNDIMSSPEAKEYAARRNRPPVEEEEKNEFPIDELMMGLKDITSGFSKSMADLTKSMADDKRGYEDKLATMVNTLNAKDKPNRSEKVLGVKSAGNSDEALTIKKQKQGVKGTFGRSGLRIKSLNI